ncbi:MAG: hypothetical protein V1664_00030 [Candidatus Uhrbacteria bacterium]
MVLDNKVREEFSHNEIKVRHLADFLYAVSDVLEKFVKILESQNSVFCVQFIVFQIPYFFLKLFDFFQAGFEVFSIFLFQSFVVFFFEQFLDFKNILFLTPQTHSQRGNLFARLFSVSFQRLFHSFQILLIALFG